MDYSYYTASTPYQYLGFASDPNQTQPTSQANGFSGTTSAPVSSQSVPGCLWSIADEIVPDQQFDSSFEPFDQNVYETNGFVPSRVQPHRPSLQSVQRTPAPSVSPSDSLGNSRHQSGLSDSNMNSTRGIPVTNVDVVGQSGMDVDPIGEELMNRARSSSEERDSMTPAQSKRKAQNRAAYVSFSLSLKN